MTGRTITLVFDAVGTLLRPREPVAETYHCLGRSHGSSLTVEQVRERFHHQRQIVFGNAPHQVSSETLERQRWRELVNGVFGELPGREALFESLWNFYANPGNWAVFPEVGPCLRQLQTACHVLAVASNFDARLHTICANTPELAPIEYVICSSEVGFCKPDQRFFQAVRQLLPADVSSSEPPLMIGDDMHKDVTAARQAGWEAVHLDRKVYDLSGLLRQTGVLPPQN